MLLRPTACIGPPLLHEFIVICAMKLPFDRPYPYLRCITYNHLPPTMTPKGPFCHSSDFFDCIKCN